MRSVRPNEVGDVNGKPVPCVPPGSSLLGAAYVRPLRARVVFAGLPPKGLLLLPFPWSGPCRARLPWRVRLWVGPPLAPLPRGVGGPLCLFLLFFPCFRVSVLFLVRGPLGTAGLSNFLGLYGSSLATSLHTKLRSDSAGVQERTPASYPHSADFRSNSKAW